MTLDQTLSREIDALAKGVRTIAARDRQPDPDLIGIAEELELTVQLCHALEQELAVFRRLEAGKSTRIAIEAVSTEAVLPVRQDGNVITPDFGGRS